MAEKILSKLRHELARCKCDGSAEIMMLVAYPSYVQKLGWVVKFVGFRIK